MENISEALKYTLALFGIFIIFVIGLEVLTLTNIDELKREINEVKKEHHIIIEYKEVPKDTIRIIMPEKIMAARYGLKWEQLIYQNKMCQNKIVVGESGELWVNVSISVYVSNLF